MRWKNLKRGKKEIKSEKRKKEWEKKDRMKSEKGRENKKKNKARKGGDSYSLFNDIRKIDRKDF